MGLVLRGSVSATPPLYAPTQLVVPSAVSTAEMIDAKICSVHLIVSFFVIVLDRFKC